MLDSFPAIEGCLLPAWFAEFPFLVKSLTRLVGQSSKGRKERGCAFVRFCDLDHEPFPVIRIEKFMNYIG
jgi:hypothetical protein